MNDPNKRIDVNLSSLLSLKAELLRKKGEVSDAKLKQAATPFIPKKNSSEPKDDKVPLESERKIEEYEDSMMLEKSRKTLEAKSKFYDKMTALGGQLNTDDNCLVLFNQKKQLNSDSVISQESLDEDEDNSTDGENEDENWVEYTDCLGRSRKCLKRDLEFFKKKDSQLADNIQPRDFIQPTIPDWSVSTKPEISEIHQLQNDDILSETGTSIISKHDQMKLNWEKKEEENIFKENIHYQDVLFDEARQHGVGYYAFSTDVEEREKQRKALDNLREKTLEAQKEHDIQRGQREKIIAERVKAAKNRQRARLGLPPLEDEPSKPTDTEPILSKKEKKNLKREEKLKKRKEEEEQKREDERKNHVRPWDKTKEGVKISENDSSSESEEEWAYRPQKEPMSQEQWNDQQREIRNPEFAPQNPFSSSFQNVSSTTNLPYNNSLGFISGGPLNFNRNNSQSQKIFKRKNYSVKPERSSIRNELESEFDDREIKPGGVEIPPPPTFEYYGPTSIKRSKQLPKPNVPDAISAGLKFLRNQFDKKTLATKSSWTATADYEKGNL